jgi:hypothetical protein
VKEIRAVVRQLEAIMDLTYMTRESEPKDPDNEITQEVTFKVHDCGYVIDCWCRRCHLCEDVTIDE